MKKTLITIGVTTVVVLTLVGIASSLLFSRVGTQFNTVSRSLADTGYGGAPVTDYYSLEAPAPAMEPANAPMVGMGGGDGSPISQALDQTSNIANDGARLVIKNADLAIVVKDPKADMERISQLAEELGGFVVSSNLYQSYYGPNSIEVPEATITIRVPSEKLNDALDKIKEGAVDVDHENTSGQDVTSEYVDLQSRLSAKQAAEKKLLEILQDADKTEDVLAVYVQLQQIETDIEVLKGQIKYYEESAALSAISVRLIAEESVQPIEVGGWKLQGTANDAVQDLINFTQGFTRFLIRFVLYVLPALLLIALPLYGAFLGGRAIFRRVRKPKANVEVLAETDKK